MTEFSDDEVDIVKDLILLAVQSRTLEEFQERVSDLPQVSQSLASRLLLWLERFDSHPSAHLRHADPLKESQG